MTPYTTMADYIYATPDKVLEQLKLGKTLCEPLVQLFLAAPYRSITFVASGSSYTAIQCAKALITQALQIEVQIVHPFTFAHYDVLSCRTDTFVVVVTQSGASTSCIEALQRLNDNHRASIVLTGNVKGDCSRYADHVVDWGCGNETNGYVTLGVVCLIVYLQLFTAYAAQEKNHTSDIVAYCREQITQAMKHHKAICELSEQLIKQHQKELMEMDRVYVLGCGSNYGTALEGALKIGETIKVLAVAYELDEFLHGPALQLSPKYHIFVIDSNDETSAHTKRTIQALQSVSDHVFVLGTDADTPHSLSIKNPCTAPFTCLYYLPYFELVAERISTALDSKHSHPLYYEMNRQLDFRTPSFRKKHPADQD